MSNEDTVRKFDELNGPDVLRRGSSSQSREASVF